MRIRGQPMVSLPHGRVIAALDVELEVPGTRDVSSMVEPVIDKVLCRVSVEALEF